MSKICCLLITFEIAIFMLIMCSCNSTKISKPESSHGIVGISSNDIQRTKPASTSVNNNNGIPKVIEQESQDIYINSIISNADKDVMISFPNRWCVKQLRYENYRSWYDIYFEDKLIGQFQIYDRTDSVEPIPNHIAKKTKTFEGQMKLGQGKIYILERDDVSAEETKSKFIIYVLIPTTIDNLSYYYNLQIDVPKEENVDEYVQVIENVLKKE